MCRVPDNETHPQLRKFSDIEACIFGSYVFAPVRQIHGNTHGTTWARMSVVLKLAFELFCFFIC